MPKHIDSQKVYQKMSEENEPRVLRKHPAFALTAWIVFTFVIQAEKKALHDSSEVFSAFSGYTHRCNHVLKENSQSTCQ